MASNFHLFQTSNRDSLHIYMIGDFDGTSAHELINALKKLRGNFKIFIDTNDLNQIHPFGVDVFQSKLYTGINNTGNLLFIGRHKHRFAF